jgi:DNA-binding SARP family transcriptional activator
LRCEFRVRRYRAGIEAVRSARVLEFRVLGPLAVVGDRSSIALGGTKQRATLAILLLNAGRVVSIERLADELYAGAMPATALKQVQRHVSDLRKLLGASAITTRSPGYVMRLTREQLDLTVFEQLSRDGSDALAGGDAGRGAELLRQALALWRGPPLADLTYELFARAPIERLEEVRLAAIQQRIEADLALGRHAEVVAELEQLVSEHPLREQFRAQLMLALYRSGRQGEALEVFRGTRETLVRDLGIEPAPALKQLERQILAQDPELDAPSAGPRRPVVELHGTVLVVATGEAALATSMSAIEPLASQRELILAQLLANDADVGRAAASLTARSAALGGNARAAAFTSADPAADVLRLATGYDVDLVLVPAPNGLEDVPLPDNLVQLLEGSPADVGIAVGDPADWAGGDGVYVPFGGAAHDWTALEVGAWLASAASTPLRLVGARSDPARGRRDASRLLANASLAVQRLVGVTSEPLLVEPNEAALVSAVEPATMVVAGVSARWRVDGIGASRRLLVQRGRRPTLLVHGGPKPGGLAPVESRTRFTWTIQR